MLRTRREERSDMGGWREREKERGTRSERETYMNDGYRYDYMHHIDPFSFSLALSLSLHLSQTHTHTHTHTNTHHINIHTGVR